MKKTRARSGNGEFCASYAKRYGRYDVQLPGFVEGTIQAPILEQKEHAGSSPNPRNGGMFETRREASRFLAVAKAGAIGRVAERLCMTQPALSRIITRLEHRIEGRLFERVPQDVRLTALGATVADQQAGNLGRDCRIAISVVADRGGVDRDLTTQAAEENTSTHSEKGLLVIKTGAVGYLRVTT